MASSDNNAKNRRSKYKKIDEDKRIQIIDKINNGESLKNVADQTGINVSTCKAILKVFHEEGRVGKKKTRNKMIDVIETYSFYCLQNCSLNQLYPMKIETGKVSLGHNEDIDELLKEKCKQKGQKILKETIQTREQVNNALQQVAPMKVENPPQVQPQNMQGHFNFYPYPMYYKQN